MHQSIQHGCTLIGVMLQYVMVFFDLDSSLNVASLSFIAACTVVTTKVFIKQSMSFIPCM